ncbi:hypothetical protein [Nocardiopsis suaedae]|uniref:Uncharacterized protein n=1 Tax=Nocardiopsis suaedae TaxID=3018444 RepID=A0ABT4TW89_9ACTN|nr:hypothetical protein [Nocardiopsis suaedae]MDA2808942.1 hypothetical protein [Nocardiopsis suaedae]
MSGAPATPPRERERITKAIADLEFSRAAPDEVIDAAPADIAERATAAGPDPASAR